MYAENWDGTHLQPWHGGLTEWISPPSIPTISWPFLLAPTPLLPSLVRTKDPPPKPQRFKSLFISFNFLSTSIPFLIRMNDSSFFRFGG
jgi:hypothetical protein